MTVCTLCGEESHRAAKCPELRGSLSYEFAESNGYRDEDEDESISFAVVVDFFYKMLVVQHNSQGGARQSKFPKSVPRLHSTLSNEGV